MSNPGYGKGVRAFIEQQRPAKRLVTAEEQCLVMEKKWDALEILYGETIENGELWFQAYTMSPALRVREVELLCLSLKIPYVKRGPLPEPLLFLPVPEWVEADGYDGVQSVWDFASAHRQAALGFIAQLQQVVRAIEVSSNW